MKRSGLIKLICAAVATLTVVLAGVLISVFNDVSEATKPTLVISSAAAIKTYDGEELRDGGWSLLEGQLAEGHRLAVNVNGSQTNVGISENFIFAQVLDKNGADVSSEYNIIYQPGSLNVRQKAITITAADAMKIYDGEPLVSDNYTIGSPMQLVDGHKLEVTVEGSLVGSAGKNETAENIIKTVKITNKLGEDVTRNYAVTTKSGLLAVYTPGTIIIESDTPVPVEYTGKALTSHNWHFIAGSETLEAGHEIIATFTGSRVNAGTGDNTFDVKILDEYGEDVTDLYAESLVLKTGKLTVMRRPVTITADSAEKVYDGKPLTESGFTVSPKFLEKDFEFDVTTSGSQTKVGTSDNVIAEGYIIKLKGNDVTDNFYVTLEPGKLTVVENEDMMRTELTYKTYDAQKTYDGTPLTNDGWQLEEGSLRPGHYAEIRVHGSMTNAGDGENDFSVEIFDMEGKPVTDQYIIKKNPGTLTVDKADVTVKSGNDQKVYDGITLIDPGFRVTQNYQSNIFEFEPEIVGAQLEIGESKNTIASCKVYLGEEDVTANFNITKEPGNLRVVATEEELMTELVFTSGSSEKVYDGVPLTNDEWSLVDGELLEDHTLEVKFDAALTKVGKLDNSFSVRIFDEDGIDVTEKLYNIEYEPGLLEVTKKPITIISGSSGKYYDGKPLTSDKFDTEPENTVVEGDELAVENGGSIIIPGAVANIIAAWSVTNEYGEDVSFCYDPTFVDGELTVFITSVVIGSESDSKSYDGEPLYCDEYFVDPEGGLGEGHYAELEITGFIVEVGETNNTVTEGSVRIFNEKGVDVTAYYNITVVEGTLTVLPPDETPDDSGNTGDGSLDLSGNIAGGGEPDSSKVYFTLYSDVDNLVYLKIQSYGNYNKNKGGWNPAPEYSELMEDGRSAYYLTTSAISASFLGSPSTLVITPNSGYFALPYYAEDGTFLKQTSDAYILGDGNAEYIVNYYAWSIQDTAVSLPSDLEDYEDSYEQFVLSNYCAVDSDTYSFMQKIIQAEGFSKDDPYIIARVANYIQNAAEYNLDYNKELDSEENIVTAFLSPEYGEGICQHYASAATLLYRTLGIPARYTVGFVGETLEGDYTEVTAAEAHAWVEVYLEGIGWVNVEVTGGFGEIEIPEDPEDPEDPEGSGGNTGDGSLDLSGKISGGGAPDKSKVYFTLYGDAENSVYLKIQSYGNYDPASGSWGKAVEYPSVEDPSMYYLPAIAIEVSGKYDMNYVTVEPVSGYFALPYYTASGSFAPQASDVYVLGDGESVYDVNYYAWDWQNMDVSIPFDFADSELSYRDFVWRQYRDVDDDTRLFMETIIEAEGFSKDDPDIIARVANYIQNAAEYNLYYNKELDSEANVVTAFLSPEYGEGICQHYASAATLLYRTLDIPARYTVGFVGETLDGDYTEVTGAEAHAWVEVYLDGIGWVSVEVTGGFDGPVIPDEPDDPEEPEERPDDGTLDLDGSLDGMNAKPDMVYYTINTDKNGTVYLKMKSYGDYSGKAWGEATVYDEIYGNYSSVYLPALSMKNTRVDQSSIHVTLDAGYYALPYYAFTKDGVSMFQSQDTVVTGGNVTYYDLTYFHVENATSCSPGLPGSYIDFEDRYYEHVLNNYLEIDDDTEEFMLRIIEEQGFSKDDPNIINDVAAYMMKKVAKYNPDYDRELDKQENIVTAFMSGEYGGGDCYHFASAATLLYRALGIPARFVEGFASPAMANKTSILTGRYAHAWVEVYVKGIGWMYVEVTAKGSPATGTDGKVELTITPTTVRAKFNGQTLYPSTTVEGFEDLAAEGYRYEAVADGQISELGFGSSRIVTFRIYDDFGDLVYDEEQGIGKDKYDVKYKEGKLQLYISKLTFSSESLVRDYNGKPLALDKSQCSLTSGALADGYTFEITPKGTLTNAGATSANFEVKIYKDGVECNSHYVLDYNIGTITVNKVEITYVAATASKKYDGTPLIEDTITLKEGALAEGDYVYSYRVEGSQTNPGYCSNVIKEIIIRNEAGENVSDNYIINTEAGRLTVTK